MTTLELDQASTLDNLDFAILRLSKQALAVKTMGQYLLTRYREATPHISDSAAQKRTYRRIAKLKEAGLLELVNPGSRPFLLRSSLRALDLLSSARNSNSCQTSPFDVPLRASTERKQSIKFLQSSSHLTPDMTAEISDNFVTYLEDCDQKEIMLKRKVDIGPGQEPPPDYLFLPYQTRFTNPEHTQKNLFIYHQIWEAASSSHKRAVHLVLTTDPKRFKSLWHANRHFSLAWNRFISYLTKRLGYRPKYISAYEYTKTGLMHCHCIIFGIPYLMPHSQITEEWERCGQGSYNYIYSLINNNGQWLYARKKPKEVKKGETAKDYLIKYISKGTTNPEALFMYWAFNKRFFTYSRALYSDLWPRREGTGIYQFMGTCYAGFEPNAMTEVDHLYAKRPPPWPDTSPGAVTFGGAA